MSKKNPLLCDTKKGSCEMKTNHPTGDATLSTALATNESKPITVTYFTDPICSSCWGIEPYLRRLKLEYGHAVDIQYHMGGLLPDWSYNSGGISKPSDVAHHWDEVSAHYQMPIDGDVWLEDPLDSSYPPSIAFKAAQKQDKKKALDFLRRIREMVFLEKKNITKWEHLSAAATESGLDAAQLKIDYDKDAIEDFKNDLLLSRSNGVRGFPTLFFSNGAGDRMTVYGYRPYEHMENVISMLLPDVVKREVPNDWKSLFAIYETLTTKEYATLSGQSVPEAKELLRSLVSSGDLTQFEIKSGTLWRLKK